MRRFLLIIALLALALGVVGVAEDAPGRSRLQECAGLCQEACETQAIAGITKGGQAGPCRQPAGPSGCYAKPATHGKALLTPSLNFGQSQPRVHKEPAPWPAFISLDLLVASNWTPGNHWIAHSSPVPSGVRGPLAKGCVLRI